MLRPKRITPSRHSAPDPSAGNPLHALRADFLEWTVAIGLSPDTAKIRNVALGYFIRWCDLRHIGCPRQVSLALLESYQLFLATSRKRDGDVIAPATQAARLNPIIAFCKWLARKRLVRKDPSIGLVLPRQVRRLPGRVPTLLEIDRILREPDVGTPSGIRDRAILETLYSTALRRTELVRLRLCDVNLEGLAVFVPHGKGGRNRVVPLGARAAGWVMRYLDEVRPRLASYEADGPVFLTDYGEGFQKNRLGDSVRRHVLNSGFPARGACHLFRHACATHMLENGADIRFIQAMLGHADLSTTQIYTQVSIAKLREIHAATHPAGGASIAPR
ncbi:MAG: tyrosine-type recombinase/integrase [Usitatibacter sp.]